MSDTTPRHSQSGREPLRVLLFSGSLRADSLNTRLASLAGAIAERQGVSLDRASMQEFDSPSFNQDLEARDGLPAGARELQRRLEACDGFVIASPEYNASMPGHLKNVIDWVSRVRPQPFHTKQCLLISASPSMVGGNRGLWSLRIPLEHLGARVYPEMFSLASAHKAFAADGTIADPKLAKRFEETLTAFLDLAEAAKHYPCIRRAWIEFLGEPDADIPVPVISSPASP